MKDLVDIYLEAGGEMLVCGPCVHSRKLDPEQDFIQGAKVVNAAKFVKEITEATNALVY